MPSNIILLQVTCLAEDIHFTPHFLCNTVMVGLDYRKSMISFRALLVSFESQMRHIKPVKNNIVFYSNIEELLFYNILTPKNVFELI